MRFLCLVTTVLLVVSCAAPARRTDLQMPYDDRLRLASIYIQSGQTDRALPLLKDAAAQEAGRPAAHAMLGEILFLQGDLDGSARHLARALEVGGDDPLILNNLAWVELDRGNAEEALDLTDRALHLEPVPIYPYLDTRARILRSLGLYADALTDARAALNLVPEHDTEMRDHLEELIRDLEKANPGLDEEGY